jgi:hypothetical protein
MKLTQFYNRISSYFNCNNEFTSLRNIGVQGLELGIFLFFTASRPALGPTQSPVKWVPGAFSPEVKRRGREADHSPPSSAKVKE